MVGTSSAGWRRRRAFYIRVINPKSGSTLRRSLREEDSPERPSFNPDEVVGWFTHRRHTELLYIRRSL
jgi:hypothetical protein